MAASIVQRRACQSCFIQDRISLCCRSISTIGRFGKRRGKFPEDAKTFKQIMEEKTKSKIPLLERPNIGMPWKPKVPSTRSMSKLMKQNKNELERTARLRTLMVSVDEVDSEAWKESGPVTMAAIANHYGLFKDLFQDAYFYPSVSMDVAYDYDEQYDLPVYVGNFLQPKEVKNVPTVKYDSDEKSLWTLIMTAPDSHLQDSQSEYLHWMVGNIPGNEISKGEQLCNYLTIFPAKGSGNHRFVFLLFKQDEKIDFSSEKRSDNCISLKQRTFNTAYFYKKFEDYMTPVGLRFFQSKYDSTVRDVFWNILDMKEPSYEFVHPPPYHPVQKKWPGKEPFNLYLDRYKDVKEINEEVLREKLKDANPFQPKPQPSKYPNVILADKDTPSWQRLKNYHKRLRHMHWKDLNN